MLKASLEKKLQTMERRYIELGALMSDPELMSNANLFREYGMEYAMLEPIVIEYRTYKSINDDIISAEEMLHDDDPELKKLAHIECDQLKQQLADVVEKLRLILVPKDPLDDSNVFLEVRAGTGGDEAALFSGDLFRMYTRYAEKHGWRIEIVSSSEADQGGFKEIIARVIGGGAYSLLKFESGAHRVQRVPVTESQGRIHTSACTVAIMPEAKEVGEVDVNPNDLRIDTFRASGAGGQHVNKTDSAIRITHIPTGLVVECQDERSQHKNKARAMSLLQARLLDQQRQQQLQETAATRKSLVGSGDRSERIRTYNFPQGRVTDHRINLTLYKLDDILEGDLDPIIEPLNREYQAEQLLKMESSL